MPSRAPLFHLLSLYERVWLTDGSADGRATFARALAFAHSSTDCCDRSHSPGHFTGSALVTDIAMTHVLLTHHKKLDKWLQLGGHADGSPRLDEVAMRECEEESGLTGLTFSELLIDRNGAIPFDLDIHAIPARGTEPTHLHYDMRFLIVADRAARVTTSEESHDVRWFALADAHRVTNERSMHRQFETLTALREGRGPATLSRQP